MSHPSTKMLQSGTMTQTACCQTISVQCALKKCLVKIPLSTAENVELPAADSVKKSTLSLNWIRMRLSVPTDLNLVLTVDTTHCLILFLINLSLLSIAGIVETSSPSQNWSLMKLFVTKDPNLNRNQSPLSKLNLNLIQLSKNLRIQRNRKEKI